MGLRMSVDSVQPDSASPPVSHLPIDVQSVIHRDPASDGEETQLSSSSRRSNRRQFSTTERTIQPGPLDRVSLGRLIAELEHDSSFAGESSFLHQLFRNYHENVSRGLDNSAAAAAGIPVPSHSGQRVRSGGAASRSASDAGRGWTLTDTFAAAAASERYYTPASGSTRRVSNRSTNGRYLAAGNSSHRSSSWIGPETNSDWQRSTSQPNTGDSDSSEDNAVTSSRNVLPVAPRYLSCRRGLTFLDLRDRRCIICKQTIPQDDFELHYAMCLTTPRVTYNVDRLSSTKGECAICLEELAEGHTIARLPCLCVYHKDCIEEWFKRKQTCPEHPGD